MEILNDYNSIIKPKKQKKLKKILIIIYVFKKNI